MTEQEERRILRGLPEKTDALLIAKLGLATAVALAASALSSAQTPPPLLPPNAGYNFPAKETLTYAVDWRVFPAGTTVMHLEQQGDEERISASGDTLGAINLHLPRQRSLSVLRSIATTGAPTVLTSRPQEGRRQMSTDLKLDYAHAQGDARREESW